MDLPRLLELIVRRLRELIDARVIAIAVPRADGTLVSRPRTESERRRSSDSSSSRPARKAAGCSSGAAASGSTRCSTIRGRLRPRPSDRGSHRPLRAVVVRDQPIGVIVAHDRTGNDPRFTNDDLRLTETFASRAAVAVDHSRRVATDALRRVVEAQELERRRLARELHDQTGQELTSVLLGLRAVEDAPDPDTHASALEACVRRSSRRCTPCGAWPSSCDRRPSTTTVSSRGRRLAESFIAQTGLTLEVEAQLSGGASPSEVETALYRMVQEALTNIVKHAEARQCQHRPHRWRGMITSRDRGRRPRLRVDAGAREWGSTACASGSA